MPRPDERRYQVFVSSTFRDLQEERQKVLQAILELRAFPAGMEMFPSADDEQWDFIRAEIESSDYYVVIVAGKYGSVADDGVSFTEKEYDFAISLRKPVMGFLVQDLEALRGAQLEVGDLSKRDKLLAFRQRVQKGKLVKFYRNADELKAQVMQALVHALQFRPQEGWVRGKNSRRLEDLEDIARLQKTVMELEAENARLKRAETDPTAIFSQGDDKLRFALELKSPRGISPPAESLPFESTWNALLINCFAYSMPRAVLGDVERGLRDLIQERLNQTYPEASRWLQLAESEGGSIGNFRTLLITVRTQFVGLSLVDIDNSKGFVDKEEWVLTNRGRLQALSVEGLRRDYLGDATKR